MLLFRFRFLPKNHKKKWMDTIIFAESKKKAIQQFDQKYPGTQQFIML